MCLTGRVGRAAWRVGANALCHTHVSLAVAVAPRSRRAPESAPTGDHTLAVVAIPVAWTSPRGFASPPWRATSCRCPPSRTCVARAPPTASRACAHARARAAASWVCVCTPRPLPTRPPPARGRPRPPHPPCAALPALLQRGPQGQGRAGADRHDVQEAPQHRRRAQQHGQGGRQRGEEGSLVRGAGGGGVRGPLAARARAPVVNPRAHARAPRLGPCRAASRTCCARRTPSPPTWTSTTCS